MTFDDWKFLSEKEKYLIFILLNRQSRAEKSRKEKKRRRERKKQGSASVSRKVGKSPRPSGLN